MLLKMLEGIHNNQVHKDSTPADTTHIELVVSAGFVLFFDFVAGPFPAIGELLVMCAGQHCQWVTGAGKETAWNGRSRGCRGALSSASLTATS
ncbi:uncharacterized protein [Lolium perenne]|uniref:uncharacterized protein isoform X2 n=1 Tax=Lolium perenne TaxID=4522 RepID=UPI003A99892F